MYNSQDVCCDLRMVFSLQQTLSIPTMVSITHCLKQLIKWLHCKKTVSELTEKCPNHGILFDGLLTKNVRIDTFLSIRTFFANNPSIRMPWFGHFSVNSDIVFLVVLWCLPNSPCVTWPTCESLLSHLNDLWWTLLKTVQHTHFMSIMYHPLHPFVYDVDKISWLG